MCYSDKNTTPLFGESRRSRGEDWIDRFLDYLDSKDEGRLIRMNHSSRVRMSVPQTICSDLHSVSNLIVTPEMFRVPIRTLITESICPYGVLGKKNERRLCKDLTTRTWFRVLNLPPSSATAILPNHTQYWNRDNSTPNHAVTWLIWYVI
jgi:hypothetical protein